LEALGFGLGAGKNAAGGRAEIDAAGARCGRERKARKTLLAFAWAMMRCDGIGIGIGIGIWGCQTDLGLEFLFISAIKHN
jgi:hypothetical protein